MSIYDRIKQFGGSVVSGIGRAFTPAPTRTSSMTTPSIMSTGGSGFTTLLNSAVSRISSWIAPKPKVVTQTVEKPVFLFGGGGGGTAPNLSGTAPQEPTLFGMPQKMGLVVVAGLVGFLILKRR
ncbi:MAG: hypothetical protein HN802_06085 [Candidatus Jacksonbacteria bacterium]|jgi:hypothetical protein|nr:hypothetical protein [Candidatus Jacksonbacteria bacterium]MBT7339234.1 hypothetical protein [Candidatus Jacksonbacteria bacterium]